MDGQTDDSFSCIEYVECEIGGQVIDKQYNLWMNIWCDLTHDLDKTKMLNKLRNGTDTQKLTTEIIDQNQPSPAALNNIAIDEIISYPGAEDIGPRGIVKHSSGVIYFSKQIGNKKKLQRINLDGSIVEDGTSLGFDVQELDIHGNTAFAAHKNGAMITRLILDNNGIPNQVWQGIVDYDGANAGDKNQLIPSIVNGVDTIGYYLNDLNSVTHNANMILVASTNTEKIVGRLYLNEDRHYQETVYNIGNVPVGSTTVFNNGIGLNDGDYTKTHTRRKENNKS